MVSGGQGEAVAAEGLRELGLFLKEQRRVASLSLRRLSELAGVSNPYLSQIERGLRTPSAKILQQLARALSLSSETLYVRAGILEDRASEDDLDRRILADPYLDDEQREALVHVYWSFRHSRVHPSPRMDREPREPTSGRERAPGTSDPSGSPARPGP